MTTLQPPTLSGGQVTPPWAGQPAPTSTVETKAAEVPPAPPAPEVPTAPPVPPVPPVPAVPQTAEEYPTQDNSALAASITHTAQQVLTQTIAALGEVVRADLCVDEGCPQHGTEHVCVDGYGLPNGNGAAKVDFSGLFAAHNIPPVPHKDEDAEYVQHLGRFATPAEPDHATSVVNTGAEGQGLQQGDTAAEMLDNPEVNADGFVEGPETPTDFIVDGEYPARIGEIPDVLFPLDAPLPLEGYVGCAIVPTYVGGNLHIEAFPYYYKATPPTGKRGRPAAHRLRFWEPRDFTFPPNTTLEAAIKNAVGQVVPAETDFNAVMQIGTAKRQHCVKVDGITYNTGKDEIYWYAPVRMKVLLLSE